MHGTAHRDDDTFYPDFDSVIEMLSTYNSKEDFIIGSLSDNAEAFQQFGYMAYGGAGVFISRSLMAKMNQPGVCMSAFFQALLRKSSSTDDANPCLTVQHCMDRFTHFFGGDAMLSYCAAYGMFPRNEAASIAAVKTKLISRLEVQPSLHQLDLKDATGFFHSGRVTTSLHHLLSWTRPFPSWHPR